MSDHTQPLLNKKNDDQDDTYTKYGTYDTIKNKIRGWIPWFKSKYQSINEINESNSSKTLDIFSIFFLVCMLILLCQTLHSIYRHYLEVSDENTIRILHTRELKMPLLMIGPHDTVENALKRPVEVFKQIAR